MVRFIKDNIEYYNFLCIDNKLSVDNTAIFNYIALVYFWLTFGSIFVLFGLYWFGLVKVTLIVTQSLILLITTYFVVPEYRKYFKNKFDKTQPF